MVLRIPETGLQLESSVKTADTLALQAFALTISDSVIEDLIQCVQNGEDIRLSLGNVPSFLYGHEVHKISKASEITDLDLYRTDPSDSTQHADRFPHPTMSVFTKPLPLKYSRLAQGRQVARPKTSAAGHKASDALERLKSDMEKQHKSKREHSTTIIDAAIPGPKRAPAKASKNNKLMPSKGGAMAGAIGRSAPASPALSGIISPALGPTLSGAEQVKDDARELRAPIVHQLALRAMSFEELRSKWPGEDSDFKPALDKAAEFDSARQKYNLKKMYWKELDIYNYKYDSDEERQTAIDNAIRMYDRARMGASEPVWDRLLPKEDRGQGKCLSKLLPTIAITTAAAKTPQIKVNDEDESSGSKNGDGGSQSGAEIKKVPKKASQPMSRQSSQTRKPPAKKIERKWVGKKEAPKVSPVKVSAKVTTSGKFKSKEFISDSDSSSEETPLAKSVSRAKESEERGEKERERQKEKEREQEREKLKERERQKERQEKDREDAAAAAAKPKPKPPHKEVVVRNVVARPAQKRPRDEADEDSSSSSSTPLNKRVSRERDQKISAPGHSNSHKRPPSESSSHSSARSNHSSSNGNSYSGAGYTSKNKNTSPVKSSPLASSPPTNASDLDHQQQTNVDERRHERERDHSRDRSVTVANGTSINVAKKRKLEADGDAIDVSSAASSVVVEKKRQRLSADVLNDARTFKKHYDAYQRLHHELSGGRFSAEVYQEKYEMLLMQRKRLEGLKKSIYSQIPRECY